MNRLELIEAGARLEHERVLEYILNNMYTEYSYERILALLELQVWNYTVKSHYEPSINRLVHKVRRL